MLKQLIKDQRGITLVEVIGAMLILGLVIAISSTLIVRSIDNKNVVHDSISLKQDTNVLINDLRRQFHEDDGKDQICFNHKANGLVVDLNNTDFMYKDGTKEDIQNEIGKTLKIQGSCIININKQKSLDIKLITKNNSGKLLETETTFISNTEDNVAIKIKPEVQVPEEPKEPEIPVPEVPEEPEDLEDPIPDILIPEAPKAGETDTQDYVTTRLPCSSEVVRANKNKDIAKGNENLAVDKKLPLIKILNVKWTGDSIEENCDKDTHKIYHDLEITNKSVDHSNFKVHVGGNLKSGQLFLNGKKSEFVVGGNAIFDQVDLKGDKSRIIVTGNSSFGQLTLEGDKSRIIVKGNVTGSQKINLIGKKSNVEIWGRGDFNGDLFLERDSKFTVKKGASFNQAITIEDDSKLNIGDEAVLKEQITIINKGQLNIGKSATFDKAVTVKGHSTIKTGEVTIFKDQVGIDNDASIEIGNKKSPGDVYFKNTLNLINDKSYVKVWGNTYFGTSGKIGTKKGSLCSIGTIDNPSYVTNSKCN